MCSLVKAWRIQTKHNHGIPLPMHSDSKLKIPFGNCNQAGYNFRMEFNTLENIVIAYLIMYELSYNFNGAGLN